MITPNNLKSVLNLLTTEEIWEVLEEHGDYVNLAISGYGHITTFESTQLPDQELIDNGMISCDKDDFLRLLEEQEHPMLTEETS